ncbi:GyrI-like domain-containing protein [Peribacillus kribbensis]|uniref:GyrI-like domain-containing protein n=1 Tax=Peribacillus kribbensis TaxID=356658 RepID=UPI000410986C|nr:GyrI-like domain-containing protein [Peribacillus kribbensis]
MEIINKEGFLAVGKKVACGWQELGTQMPEAWRQVLEKKDEIKNRVSPYILDICLHVRDGEFTQLVGVEVSSLSDIPEGFEGAAIPKQKYLYSHYSGPVTDIAGHFGKMMSWAEENCLMVDPEDFKIQYTPEKNDEEGYSLYVKLA